MKKGLFSAALVAIALAGAAWLYERHSVADARSTLAAQQVRLAQLRQQLATLESQRAETKSDPIVFGRPDQPAPNTLPSSSNSIMDLEAEADIWRLQLQRLRATFAEHPDQKIPELQLLSDLEWLDLARQLPLGRDERLVRAAVRDFAVKKFLTALRPLLQDYRASSGAEITEVAQIAPLFKPALDPAILARYQIVPDALFGGKNRTLSIVERQPIDEDFDTRQRVTTTGSGGGGSLWITYPLQKAREDGIDAYRAANGKVSTKAAETLPFVQDPLSRAFLETIAAYDNDHEGRTTDDPAGFVPYATTPKVRALLERMTRAMAARRTANP